METFASLYDRHPYDLISIEDKDVDFSLMIQSAETIFIGYPIHGSLLPFLMKDFLLSHLDDFKGKNISTIVTQMVFSGDGGALAYRLLKKAHVRLEHSIHINMPNNITDVQFLRPKTLEESRPIIEKANQRIKRIIQKINQGKTIRMGRHFYSRFIGFIFQRLYGYYFYPKMRTKLKIHHNTCILCNQCVEACPTSSLIIENNRVVTHPTCTACYRCINICPTQSISMNSKKSPKVQYIMDKYN